MRCFYSVERQRKPEFLMGIIELPDNAHEKGETTLEDKLVRWISRERIPIVTGNFGKNNQPLIASTAVAAQATVRCRIRTFFDWDKEHRINHKSTHWERELFGTKQCRAFVDRSSGTTPGAPEV